MGARVEQPGEFLPCAGRARRCHLEDLADSLHRLPSAAEDLQVIIFRSNRALLLQGEFRITLLASSSWHSHLRLTHTRSYLGTSSSSSRPMGRKALQQATRRALR